MVALRRVLESVGPPLATVLVEPADLDAPVGDLVIAEPDAAPDAHPGDLVLGVAVTAVDQAERLVGQCATAGALVLKEPVAADPSVRRAAADAGLGLLSVTRRAAWTQVLWLLRSVLDLETTAAPDLSGGGEFTDLFTLADAIAAVIDAPVTIEDAGSRVLAYSSRQDRADPARVATIIGRRVPDATLQQFRRRGVLREVGKGAEPVFVPSLEDGTLPRLIMPVKVGSELLGSIWAVVPGPVSAERAAAFADTAAVVALHLLRLRAGTDVERRLMRDLVATVLHGSGDVASAAARLGLRAVPHRVVAFGLRRAADGETAPERAEALRLALWERLRSASGLPARTPLAEVGGAVYAVVECDQPTDVVPRWEWLSRALAELAPGVQVLAGISAPATEVGDLARARAQADEVHALLHSSPGLGRWARFEEVWARLVVRRVAGSDALAELLESGPVRLLREHDAAHGTRYVETLAAWLTHAGDQAAVARRLHVHRNTLRYRMRRIAEIAPARLDDPDVRLALQLQLVALGAGR
ncbi:DNA-binding transcriptional regulator, PucR family [Streptoalloteichus tenebrarius]|uniref:DNA-binding transcriptional regulator, PucR family n=1 Tax=Streptoalloteichus tenebrarius (strain ATCC 17920 / DSM 40477 / JCM 4838 / CBS 697.72 / NBRC 16177 / NCIMB 11028 / NRRL B-12390 / A12253. 1 / ISP 5477) TaxID=1933 RepID=A0ABT1HME5_STRSD|nr:helix-turn-helix domain-containing protein [Streptoalloteichus tenebrarius]MCP2256680.1 DNA-binding transcriptional regulator, PucR family [Streptoalloteichus tenebrarius]BFF00421.1 PucR family transcriptional regulator [Streptoalloteichus tenebrarius]